MANIVTAFGNACRIHSVETGENLAMNNSALIELLLLQID